MKRHLLKSSERITIGVLSDDVSNGYSEPIVAELADAARERGVALINFVEWLDPDALQTKRRLTIDLAGPASCDAVLVLPIGYNLSADDLAGYCERFDPLPVCSIPEIAGKQHSRVSVNNESGMREGIRHLVEVHQYKRIGFVRGPERSVEADLRYRVYREVLAEHGITPDPSWIAPGNYVTQGGLDAVRLFYDERKLKLDAIVSANDGMALGVLEGLAARGIKVPHDVALMGFDDVDLARYVDPPLTTVRQPLRELGRTALEHLIERVATGGPPEQRVLPSELVIRESCGCLSYRDGRKDSSRAPADSEADSLVRAAPDVTNAMRSLGIPGAPSSGWPDKLFGAFASDALSGTEAFLEELHDVLDRTSKVRGDVGGFHKVLTLIWQRSTRALSPGSVAWRRADVLLHAARAVVSSTAERVQSSRQVRFEDFAYKLTRTSNALALVPDLASLGGALAQELPLYGIPAGFVCLYDDERGAREADGFGAARLVAGVGPSGPLVLPQGGIWFRAGSVLPDSVELEAEQLEYVVGPLSRAGDSPGYAVFARGPLEGFVYENLFSQLGGSVRRLELMARLLTEATRREAAERRRMEEELAIATRIQTSVLPRNVATEGLEIAAVMLPATEVGGDYYDVIPTQAGCWLGIGDVAGHGLPTGVVMLMLQSVVSGLVRTHPHSAPRDILCAANAVLFDNIRERMKQDEHMTLTLLRFESGGRLTFAGAHEDLLIYRAAEKRTEWIETPGTWIGAVRDIEEATRDTSCELKMGDVLVLYTDGVTEAKNHKGEQYGPDRFAAALARVAEEPVEAIRDGLLADVRAWMQKQEDDLTFLIVRHRIKRA
ncbi:MAG TPA: substrate-binding domain-containing protein [Polyangiaceae bacterium]|nr:substrate-binding domain-containing protein [Polyangiaceae bacterium]